MACLRALRALPARALPLPNPCSASPARGWEGLFSVGLPDDSSERVVDAILTLKRRSESRLIPTISPTLYGQRKSSHAANEVFVNERKKFF